MTIAQINQGNNEFSTISSSAFHSQQSYITLTTAVHPVVEPCNIAVYLHSK